ncbi:MAG: 50S ribosomal protein L35 [Parcubacteria group bacterium]|nr:50S ribosomal protein L35 [Parcubacteria group bacterium]
MPGKTRKSITKRFKITKNGKMLRRLVGQDHYRQKKTGKRRRHGRRWIPLSVSETKKFKKLFSY